MKRGMYKNIKPIQAEFWARMAYDKEHEVKLDAEEKVKIHLKTWDGMASKNLKENLS